MLLQSGMLLVPYSRTKSWYKKAASILLNEKQQDLTLAQFLSHLIESLKLDAQNLYSKVSIALKSSRSNTAVPPQEFKTGLSVVRKFYFDHMESASKWTIEPYLNFFLSEEWNAISIENRIAQIRKDNKFTSFISNCWSNISKY